MGRARRGARERGQIKTTRRAASTHTQSPHPDRAIAPPQRTMDEARPERAEPKLCHCAVVQHLHPPRHVWDAAINTRARAGGHTTPATQREHVCQQPARSPACGCPAGWSGPGCGSSTACRARRKSRRARTWVARGVLERGGGGGVVRVRRCQGAAAGCGGVQASAGRVVPHSTRATRCSLAPAHLKYTVESMAWPFWLSLPCAYKKRTSWGTRVAWGRGV